MTLNPQQFGSEKPKPQEEQKPQDDARSRMTKLVRDHLNGVTRCPGLSCGICGPKPKRSWY